MSKITVENFIKQFKSSNDKDAFIKQHITTKYVDILTKQVYAKNIADKCNHIAVGEKKIYKSNSLNTYIFFTLKLIELYTDIDLSAKDINLYTVYDQLNKNGLIDFITVNIPENECKEFKVILDMETSDLHQNEYSVSALLYSIKESLSMGSEVFGKVLDNLDLT